MIYSEIKLALKVKTQIVKFSPKVSEVLKTKIKIYSSNGL